MQIYNALIPRDEKRYDVTVAFVEAYTRPTGQESSLVYMNRVRLFPERTATSYLPRNFARDLPGHRRDFQRLLKNLTDVGVIVGAPSDQPFVGYFLAEARACFPSATNLTASFSKEPGASVGEATSMEEAVELIKMSLPQDLQIPDGAVLIVDNILADGRTAAAILLHLEQCGVLQSRKVYVAAPLASTREGPLPPREPTA